MITRKNTPTLNLRELTGYLFIFTILLFGIVLAWMLARMFEPRGDWQSLARISDLNYALPTRMYLTARDGTRINVWLAFDDEWRAFDGLTPTWFPQNCPYAWQDITQRFEDPCSGAKFGLDGKYLEGYVGATRRLATDLVQYQIETRGDSLWINLDDKIVPPPVPTAVR